MVAMIFEFWLNRETLGVVEEYAAASAELRTDCIPRSKSSRERGSLRTTGSAWLTPSTTTARTTGDRHRRTATYHGFEHAHSRVTSKST